ncbi:MAG: peptide chain release factor N(5)-glutamine methyltransferase [Deltaproteobacteria bacterium]|nr:peptide chain release factor N(5)-glutamine methyltransferase [Deltaproteobacteria bacterium]
MAKLWTVAEVLDFAAADFSKRGMERPRLEAELLLAALLGVPRIALYTGFDKPLAAEELAAFRASIELRRAGEPSAYITGTREFWSLGFAVDRSVLVPRPDTETLVQAALDRLAGGPVLDLCTGSGCVAVALAHSKPDLVVDATDLSTDACRVAEANAARHGVSSRVRVRQGDLFEAVPPGVRYAVIVSNPPYVPDAEIDGLSPEVRCEPRMALAGGADGLDLVRRIVADAPSHLVPGGLLLLEIDPRQAADVAGALGADGFETPGEIVRDLAGRDRIVALRLA